MTEIYLPTLSHWVHRNPWTGSIANARYSVFPRAEEDLMDAASWVGPLNSTLSEMEQTAVFPISEEGIEELRAWIANQCDEINSRT